MIRFKMLKVCLAFESRMRIDNGVLYQRMLGRWKLEMEVESAANALESLKIGHKKVCV